MRRISFVRWIMTSTAVFLTCAVTLSSPTLREYVEVDYDNDTTPVNVRQRWELHDKGSTKVRVSKRGATSIMVVDRDKQKVRFWFSSHADKVFVPEITAEWLQSQRLKISPPAVPPGSEWKPLGEKQVAGVRCKGWSAFESEGKRVELWIDEHGTVVYSASFYEGRLVSHSLRVRQEEKPLQSDRSLFAIPSDVKEKRINAEELSSLLMNFFLDQQAERQTEVTKGD